MYVRTYVDSTQEHDWCELPRLRCKQHQIIEDDTGFTTKFRQDLFVSKDLNFRPVDLEFAPDGSLYVVDWQNVLIGHMQHNIRDPNRDHNHGRIYLVTSVGRPLLDSIKLQGAPIEPVCDALSTRSIQSSNRLRATNAVNTHGHALKRTSVTLRPAHEDLRRPRLRVQDFVERAVRHGYHALGDPLLREFALHRVVLPFVAHGGALGKDIVRIEAGRTKS